MTKRALRGNPLTRLLRLIQSIACVAACCSASWAFGQSDRPLELVVGFPAGGTLDIVTRELAEGLRARLHRPVIVENRPGAGGIIAAGRVKAAAADGDVFLVAPTTAFTLYPLTVSKLPYAVSDFVPVVHIARFEYALGIGMTVPARNLAEYVALVKRDPKYGLYGAPGVGGPPHFYGQIFAARFKLDMGPVPYQGTAALTQDLQANQTPAAMLPLAELGKLASSGRARLIATTGAQRTKQFPDVPTFDEAGVPVSESGQYAMYARAGTAPALLDALALTVQEILKSPSVKARYASMYIEPTGLSGLALTSAVTASETFWRAAVRANPEVASAVGR